MADYLLSLLKTILIIPCLVIIDAVVFNVACKGQNKPKIKLVFKINIEGIRKYISLYYNHLH